MLPRKLLKQIEQLKIAKFIVILTFIYHISVKKYLNKPSCNTEEEYSACIKFLFSQMRLDFRKHM